MDKDIAERVVGLLTVVTSTQADNEDMTTTFLKDFFEFDISVPEPHTIQDVANAVAAKMKAPLTDLFMAFCVAFSLLARANDDPSDMRTSAEVLRSLGLYWARDAE